MYVDKTLFVHATIKMPRYINTVWIFIQEIIIPLRILLLTVKTV